jgi:TetR/AcrR family transcriptional regulator, transcriptional repressor for nem operon
LARVTKETAAAHREALIEAAGRLFREKGVDGVGVAQISKAAGLTHGALYSGFSSKEELTVSALKAGARARRQLAARELGANPSPSAIVKRYVSKAQRDDRVECCPLLASASEAARQGTAYREAFTEVFLEWAKSLEAAMDHGDGEDAESDRARVVVASMIGVVAVARALEGKASDRLLGAARRHLAALASPDAPV